MMIASGTFGASMLAVVFAASCARGHVDEQPGKVEQPGVVVTISPCARACQDVSCVDNDPCTRDVCLCGTCTHPSACEDPAGLDTPCVFRGCTVIVGVAPACDLTDSYLPASAPCDDDDPCTTADRCDGDGECSGTRKNCDDSNECTSDSCNAVNGACRHEPVADGTECDDGTDCSAASVCEEGACVAADGDVPCDDGNPCTEAVCDPTSCTNVPSTGTPCNSDPCLTAQTCNAIGVCSGGAPTDCGDDNQCTSDACDPDIGCVYEPLDGTECADGDLCTTGDRCADGECIGPEEVDCAPNDCHESSCDSALGECTSEPKEDGVACGAGAGVCADGECIALGLS